MSGRSWFKSKRADQKIGKKMFKTIILIGLLISSTAFADEVVMDVGLGALNSRNDNISQVKMAKVGVQEDVWYNLKQRFNVGGWTDARGQDFSGSAFAGYQLGFVVRNDVFEASIFSGPTVISSTDALLGGHFQFNETLFLGIVDKNDNAIGLAWNHFSSAGIEMPNYGRDFAGLEIKFPF
jgi:hypothetical protein